jgi:hypothetical protein
MSETKLDRTYRIKSERILYKYILKVLQKRRVNKNLSLVEEVMTPYERNFGKQFVDWL